MLKDATAIVGIGETEFAKQLAPSEKALACRAILTALDDAGIAPGEVDGFSSYTMEQTDEVEIAKNIGAGGVTVLQPGAVRRRRGTGLRRASRDGDRDRAVPRRRRVALAQARLGRTPMGGRAQASANALWTRPHGLLRPVDEIALLTRRYMHEYGATREHLANVAIAVRKAANRNPRAIMYAKTLSREAVHGGALDLRAAVPVRQLPRDRRRARVRAGSAERARDCRRKPVYMHAFGQGLPPQHHTMVNYWCEDPLRGPAWTCAEQLYRHSDIRPRTSTSRSSTTHSAR
jgi:hypothetical protein